MTDQTSPLSPLHPAHAPAADSVPAAEALPPASKKDKKVKSVGIAFASRVTAQLVGAAATVFLGLAVMNSQGARSATPSAARVSTPATPVAYVKAHRGAGPALVVLPFADYSPSTTTSSMADGLTDAVTTALARSGRVHVTSRTSAMQYKQAARPVPAIAAELGVDLVVEGSIVRQGDRVRVTVQLIDAASDAHLWAQTYDRPAGDVLAFDAEIGATIDRDLAGVLPRALQSPGTSAATSATADVSTPLHPTPATF
jgi:TolB-like protein